MGFVLSSGIVTQTGQQQSQAVATITPALTINTGRITAAASWELSIVDGTAITITSSSGVYKGALCVASVSGVTLTYYRLYDEDKSRELTPTIAVGDLIYICENAEDVASGGAKLASIAGVTSQVAGAGKSRSAVYGVGDLQLKINGFFQIRSLDIIEFGSAASNTLGQFATGTGTLVVGDYKTINGITVYSSGTAIKSARTGLFYFQTGAIGRLEWFGNSIILQSGGITGGNIQYLRAYSQNCVLSSQTTETQFRYDGVYDWVINGLTTTGFAGVNFVLGLNAFKRWKSRGSELFAVGLSNSTPINTWVPIVCPDFDGSNVGDLRGIGSRWYDITNPVRGHKYSLTGSAMLARSRQDVRVKIVDPNGAAIKGKVWIKESYNSGRRLQANVLQSNPSYTLDVTYSGEAANGVFDANIVCMYFYATAGVPIEDYRFVAATLSNGNVAVNVPARVASYGYVSRELILPAIGETRFEAESRMVTDTTIVQRTASVVAAYVELNTSEKVYDYDRLTRYNGFDGDLTSPIGRGGVNLIVTGRSVIVDKSAQAVYFDNGTVITIKASVFIGNITVLGAGTITLANGAAIDGVVLDANNAGSIGILMPSLTDTVEMRRYSDGGLIASRNGPGNFSVSPANVGNSVYFVRLNGSNIVMSTISTYVNLTSGTNTAIPLYAGAEVQMVQASRIDLLPTLADMTSAGFAQQTTLLKTLKAAQAAEDQTL